MSSGAQVRRRATMVGDAGSSLVELLVAMGITVSVLGVSGLLAAQMQGAYQLQNESTQSKQEGRYALDLIARYLRAAGNNPYSLLISPCPAAGTPILAIRIDPNGDKVNDDIRLQSDVSPTNGRIGGLAKGCTEADEDVTFGFDRAQHVVTLLDNNIGGGAQPKTDTVVSALQFVYRDASRNLTAVAANVVFVEVDLTVQSRVNDPATKAPAQYALSSDIRLRNR